jgi:hypothetical protein
MKLDDYTIKDQLEAKDWCGATRTIAGHYGLQLPGYFAPELFLGDVESPQIDVYLSNKCYHWSYTKSFIHWTRSRDYNTFQKIKIAITVSRSMLVG